MNKLIVIGAGGHSKVIQDIINDSGEEVIYAILDDAFSHTVIKKDVIYSHTDYIQKLEIEKYYFVIAIGNNQIRKSIVEKLSIPNQYYATLIHPSAVVSPTSKIKTGTVVMPGAVINADSIIGNHSIINTNAVIEHDNTVSEFVHVSPGSVLSGGVTIAAETHLGSGSIILPGIKIGFKSIIGAGSVVTKDISDNVTVAGIPAKIIKE